MRKCTFRHVHEHSDQLVHSSRLFDVFVWWFLYSQGFMFSFLQREAEILLRGHRWAGDLSLCWAHIWRGSFLHVVDQAIFRKYCSTSQKPELDFISLNNSILLQTHWGLETPKRVTGKQCRPRSDAAECGVWSGSPLFANINHFSLGISTSYNLTYLKSKMDSSNI